MTDGPVTDAIVVAAGASSRMGGRDKLDELLAGRPLLAWSVEAMARADGIRDVIVVAAASRVDALREAEWLNAVGGRVVEGGRQRSDSVLAGVRASTAELVLVHDGARPLATPVLAASVRSAAAIHGAAVPAIPLADSLKRANDGRVEASLGRQGLVRAQTPQAARRELLLAAFAASAGASFSDEAALLEAHGVPVAVVPGDPHNIKVTEPADLDVVRAIVAGREVLVETRLGAGQDSHSFGPDDGLWLGGILLPEAPRLHGHSDGDVALHALATAILSAAGEGDLGRLFPASDPDHRGAASAGMLTAALALAAAVGWRPAAAHVSLLGARPRLGAQRLDAMRARMAELLGIDLSTVAVTASTGNLAGPEGAGRSISASALVTLARS